MAKPLTPRGSVTVAVALGVALLAVHRQLIATWVRLTHTYVRTETSGGNPG
jgi:hypothetical protein